MLHFLVHNSSDNVGVAVVDIAAGSDCEGKDLSTNKPIKAHAQTAIPLGHKIALKDFAVGDTVTKYSCPIGQIVQAVKAGELIHTHNLKTKRWA